MPTFKTIDLYASVADAKLTDSSSRVSRAGVFPSQIIFGEVVLLRWTVFETSDSTTAFAIGANDGLEFIISDRYNASESQILVYSHTRDSISGDWSDYDRSAGKVSMRVNFNSDALSTHLGSNANKSDLIGELVIVPSGTEQHITVAQFDVVVRNEVYPSTAELDIIDLFPPAESSSASESSSSGGSSASSASSTSESSDNNSSSESSSSQSSTSESSDRTSISSSSSESSSSSSSASSASSSSSSSSSTQANPSSQSSTSESSANSSSSSASSSVSSTSESSEFAETFKFALEDDSGAILLESGDYLINETAP